MTKSRSIEADKNVRVQAVVKEAKRIRSADAVRAKSLISLIHRRKVRITEDFYEIGVALRELYQHRLWAAVGATSFEHMLAESDLFGPTQARKLIAIATSLSRDEALSLGEEKSFALLSYAAATPRHEVPKLVLRDGIEGKQVAKLSVRQIHAAAEKLRAQQGRKRVPTPAEKEAALRAKSLQRWLRRNGFVDATVWVSHAHGHVVLDARFAIDHVPAAVRDPK